MNDMMMALGAFFLSGASSVFIIRHEVRMLYGFFGIATSVTAAVSIVVKDRYLAGLKFGTFEYDIANLVGYTVCGYLLLIAGVIVFYGIATLVSCKRISNVSVVSEKLV